MSAVILLQYAEQAQQTILQDACQIFGQAQVPYRSFAELGHPVERIHQIAAQEKTDLIVIGSQGLSAWPALLLGSVSEGVAQHAHCSVLVMR